MKFTVTMITVTPKAPGRGRKVSRGVFVHDAESIDAVRARFKIEDGYRILKIVGPAGVQWPRSVIR